MRENGVLVEARDLVVSFSTGGRTLRAVDGVNLSIKPGETVGLVGESGSGKTTLAKTVLRLYRPSSGALKFEGTDISKLGDAALKAYRRRMQMVFQDPLSSFNPRVRVGEAIALPLRLAHRFPSAAMAAKVEALLHRVGLGPQFVQRYPHEMSGG